VKIQSPGDLRESLDCLENGCDGEPGYEQRIPHTSGRSRQKEKQQGAGQEGDLVYALEECFDWEEVS